MKHLDRYLLIVNVLDQAFRVPGTRWRFGLDSIVGLIPGVGDIAMAVVGSYGLVIAHQLGAPASVQFRMLLNLAVDAAVGAIPVLGDVFDFAFKSNVRNARLLQDWLARPHETRRSSSLVLFGVMAVFGAVLVAAVWFAMAAVRGVYHLVAGA
jgi:hypothetical protein